MVQVDRERIESLQGCIHDFLYDGSRELGRSGSINRQTDK